METDKPTKTITNSQLNIKLSLLTEEEQDTVLKTIKKQKTAGLDKIPPEVQKRRKFNDILLQLSKSTCIQSTTEKWTKDYIFSFLKKSNHRITMDYRDKTLTALAAKVYNSLLLNIKTEIKYIVGKNQNGFQRNWSISPILLVKIPFTEKRWSQFN